MSIYNVAAFGSEDDIVGDYYGESPRLQYSAEPFNATAISYTEAVLDWKTPAGDYSEIRVVRSNDGYPETQEDGAIIWSWNDSSGLDKITTLVDGRDLSIPLVSGRFVYYRIWIKTSDTTWKIAADSITLIPFRHATFAPDGTELVTTQNKLLDVIPRVFTTATQSPIDEVDPNSPLANFLSAFSFELDRIQTYAGLLFPLESGRLASPEILLLQSLQLGLPIEPYLATKQQRRLAREALFIYQNKGTKKAIETFVESLTGFAPVVTTSPNLILTAQDSSFTSGTGFWRAVGGCTLELETTVPGVPPTTEPFVDDYRYTAKVVVTEAGARIISGTDKPKTQGTPVVAGTPYTFSGYGKSASGDMGVYAYAIWYGYEGEVVRVDPPRIFPVVTQTIPDTDWTRYEFVGRAPGVKQTVLSVSVDTGVATITLSPYNVMLPTNTVKISGIVTENSAFDAVINGYHQILNVGAVGENWIQIPLAALDQEDTSVFGLLEEAYPTLAGPLGENNVYYDVMLDINATTASAAAAFSGVYYGIGMASVTSNVATLVMDSVDDLSIGDVFLVQGVDATFSYGLHVLTGVDTMTNSVTFNLTSADVAYGPGALGFGMRVVPNSGMVTKEAHYAGFEFLIEDTGTIYLDLLQMATFDVSEFHEARATEIFLQPNKSNFLKNPGFNPTTVEDNWIVSSAGATVVDRTAAPLSLVGSGYALSVTTNETVSPETATVISSTTGAISTGKFVTASVYARTENADTFEAMNFSATAYDVASGSPVAVATANTDIVITDTMTRFSVTMFVPGNADFSTSTVGVNFLITGATTGNKVYFDHAIVENSFAPTDYIDGDLHPSYGAVWQGTEYDSASHLYPGLYAKVTRLQQELEKYIPINSSFLIRWYDGTQPYGGIAKPLV